MSVSEFFILSDWANLFHSALQGLVTNELQENDYFVDIPTLLPDLNPNTTSIVGFWGESESLISKEQLAGFLSLALSAGNGTNSQSNLTDLVDCTMRSGCFDDSIQPAAESFIACYLFDGILKSPPCNKEFDAVIESANYTQSLKCLKWTAFFRISFDRLKTLLSILLARQLVHQLVH